MKFHPLPQLHSIMTNSQNIRIVAVIVQSKHAVFFFAVLLCKIDCLDLTKTDCYDHEKFKKLI